MYGSGDGKELDKCRECFFWLRQNAYLYSHLAISM